MAIETEITGEWILGLNSSGGQCCSVGAGVRSRQLHANMFSITTLKDENILQLAACISSSTSMQFCRLTSLQDHLPQQRFQWLAALQNMLHGRDFCLTSWRWNLLNRRKPLVNIYIQLNYRYLKIRMKIGFVYVLISLKKKCTCCCWTSNAMLLWAHFFEWWGHGESTAETGHMTQILKHFVASFGSWKHPYSFHGMHNGKIKWSEENERKEGNCFKWNLLFSVGSPCVYPEL